MDGKMLVSYKILCKSDVNVELTLGKLLQNEKVAKVIKSEFAKGFRNISLGALDESAKLNIGTDKEIHTFEALKDDFADLLTLAEDDAVNKKLLKKECDRIELLDIQTLD